jgi:hypothetical protein
MNSEPIAGDMHLNADEYWNVGSSIDLFSVALHEAGHALGLAHTDDPAAVMYPYYKMNTGLSANDIGGIQALYGVPGTSAAPPTQSVTPAPAPAALTITIASPAANYSTTGTTVSLSGSASGGTGALRITWADDRGGSGSASGSTNWTIAAATLATGANNITVTATDAAGKTASKTILITRATTPTTPASQPADTTPPTLQIQSPSMISTSASTISLSGVASDNVGVTAVRWSNTFGQGGDAIGTTNWQIASIPLLVGTNKITVRAYDAAGNSRWQLVTVVRH